ncbi:MAG TPA: hypothetical protein VK454_12755 [Myxococcaceae bacterium]|nr:hypothetical protein [Myxococcaceae bacterium]
MNGRIVGVLFALVAAATAAGCSNPYFNCTGKCDTVVAAAQVIQASNADNACAQMVTEIANAGCTGIATCTLCVEQ